MDSADFLNVSARLCASSAEEDCRTAVSRSYYALYNVLYIHLSSQGVQFTTTGLDHKRMIHYLLNCEDANASRLGYALRNLQTNRIIADYRMNQVVTQKRSEFAYRNALAMVRFYRGLDSVKAAAMLQAIRNTPLPSP